MTSARNWVVRHVDYSGNITYCANFDCTWKESSIDLAHRFTLEEAYDLVSQFPPGSRNRFSVHPLPDAFDTKDRASNEISDGMGALIESARLAPPLPTAAQERADADLRKEAEAALKAEARQVARTLVVLSGTDCIGIGSYEPGIAAIVQLDADGVKRRARTAESWVAYIADALYKFATRTRPAPQPVTREESPSTTTHIYGMRDSGAREEQGTGAVRDTRVGKGRFDLISPSALARVARVYERGAIKYDARNWERGMTIGRFIDSGLRHVFQYLAGDTSEDHLAQATWNFKAAMHMEAGIKGGHYPWCLDDVGTLRAAKRMASEDGLSPTPRDNYWGFIQAYNHPERRDDLGMENPCPEGEPA